MCRVLEVSRSGYYASCANPIGKRRARDAALLPEIHRIHKASRGTFGSPRVCAQLLREGKPAGKHRVARVMRNNGITWKARKRFRVTTQYDHRYPIAPNVLNRAFAVSSKDSAWCADITYVHTSQEWIYLAAVIDLATRLVVGWELDRHMQSSLVESALKNALLWREPANRLVHHSDRGSPYASDAYRSLLAKYQIECSMSRKGNCWDNAVMESFFGTYKQELAHYAKWNGLDWRKRVRRRWTTSRFSTTANAFTLHLAIAPQWKSTRPRNEFSTSH